MAYNTNQTNSINAPAIATGPTAMSENTSRIGWQIQNQGVNVLYVALGTSASAAAYHQALSACATAADGTGGKMGPIGPVVYTGIIKVAGTSPSYTVIEQ